MRKLIKVIAVPVLCCIILCILFFMVDFRSNGEEVSVPRAIDAADGSRWYYIRIDGRIYGFVHSAYIEKV